MEMIGGILQMLGGLLGLVGHIWIVVLGFQKSPWWGIGCLIVPCVNIVFAIQNWAEAKTPFLIYVGGIVVQIIGIVLLGAGLANSGALAP